MCLAQLQQLLVNQSGISGYQWVTTPDNWTGNSHFSQAAGQKVTNRSLVSLSQAA